MIDIVILFVVLIRNFYVGNLILIIIFLLNNTERQLPLTVFTVSKAHYDWLTLQLILFFSMSNETYQEIKRISGEELKELLSNLDSVFDLSTGTLLGHSYLASSDY